MTPADVELRLLANWQRRKRLAVLVDGIAVMQRAGETGFASYVAARRRGESSRMRVAIRRVASSMTGPAEPRQVRSAAFIEAERSFIRDYSMTREQLEDLVVNHVKGPR